MSKHIFLTRSRGLQHPGGPGNDLTKVTLVSSLAPRCWNMALAKTSHSKSMWDNCSSITFLIQYLIIKKLCCSFKLFAECPVPYCHDQNCSSFNMDKKIIYILTRMGSLVHTNSFSNMTRCWGSISSEKGEPLLCISALNAETKKHVFEEVEQCMWHG